MNDNLTTQRRIRVLEYRDGLFDVLVGGVEGGQEVVLGAAEAPLQGGGQEQAVLGLNGLVPRSDGGGGGGRERADGEVMSVKYEGNVKRVKVT